VTPKPFHEDDGDETGKELATAVHQQKFDPTLESNAAFLFAVTEGPDTGLQFVLDPAKSPRVLVGQSPVCELRLTDKSVSRRHAAIELVGTSVRITDTGSTNGTFINGVCVTEARLFGGETLKLGADVIAVARTTGAVSEPHSTTARFGKVLGASLEMRRLYALCQRLAAATMPVIIEGEPGTGKEALAEAIHEVGPRSGAPFVVFDCAAVAAVDMEAELFGYEAGAVPGAQERHIGVLEQASGGTLLIDEIGDLAPALQPRLLRVLEGGEFRRLGGQAPIRADVRILGATRRNLDREVEAGRFRDDLYHRLAVGRIELPPLRHRRGDVGVLATAFWQELGGSGPLPPELIARWNEYAWPGNVRELRNAVARFLAMGELAADRPAAAPPRDQDSVAAVVDEVIAEAMPLVRARQRVVDAFEQRYLEAMLARHGGIVTRAAAAAGIARRHFQRLRARPR
jgi:DNA-binding NtrC family response regulator